MFAYLSLGTNIEPEKNAMKMVEALCEIFGTITLYPFVYTEAIDMDHPSTFLNALVIVKTTLDETALKQRLVELEIQLGRDRQDPDRSIKDRPADIDIVAMSEQINEALFHSEPAPYILACLSPRTPKANLGRFGLPPHQRAATVNWDRSASQVVIVENEV